jgi:ADP-heptose:LPS heptosyltransferase
MALVQPMFSPMLSSRSSTPHTLTLVRTHAAGDLLMLTALLPALKARYARVELVVSEPFATVLQGHPLLDAQYVIPHGKLGNPWRMYQLKQKVKQVLAEQSPVSKAQRHVVYLTYPSGLQSLGQLQALLLHQPWLPHFLQTALTPKEHLLQHFAKQVALSEPLSVLEAALSLPPLHTETPYPLPLARLQKAVVIQTRASVIKKEWPLAFWETWVQHMQTLYPDTPLLRIGSAGYHPPLAGVVDIETPHLHDAFALLAQCRLFIGLDSVFNHAMQALQKPSIILYGATHPARFGYQAHANIWKGQCRQFPHLRFPAMAGEDGQGQGVTLQAMQRFQKQGYHPAMLHTTPECLVAVTQACLSSLS